MKNLILALTVFTLFSTAIISENTPRVEHSMTPIHQAMGDMKGNFLDANFMVGKIVFKDGTSSQQKLNYHFASNSISFMNDKGEFFTLADLGTVELITYGNRNFVPINKSNIAELLKTFDDGSMLLIERKTRVRKMDGAYGSSSITASTTNLSSAPSMGIYDRIEPENAPKPKVSEVFILMKDGKRHTISRLKSLRNIFKHKWDEIRTYDKQHKPDLKHAENLIALLEFCME